jgi:hypothetical protein
VFAFHVINTIRGSEYQVCVLLGQICYPFPGGGRRVPRTAQKWRLHIAEVRSRHGRKQKGEIMKMWEEKDRQTEAAYMPWRKESIGRLSERGEKWRWNNNISNATGLDISHLAVRGAAVFGCCWPRLL